MLFVTHVTLIVTLEIDHIQYFSGKLGQNRKHIFYISD